MLKIQRKENGKIVFILSGRIEAEDIDELSRLLELESAGSHIVLDLKDVTLVDPEAINFLIDCEANNIKLEDCPPYVRERIKQESGRPRLKNRVLAKANCKKGVKQ
jgi:hypothetical protein